MQILTAKRAAARASRWLAVAALATCAGTASAATAGPGTGVSSTGADGGERLNVSDAPGTFVTLQPGTYDVADFSYNSTGAGDVIPFLVTPAGADSYNLLWIGTSAPGTGTGTVSVNPAGTLTLDSPTDVYAGFYTATNGRVAFAGGGSTDHAGAVAVPRGGVTMTQASFSNANLSRTYAFSITADPVARQTAGGGFLSNSNADGGERLNVDNNRSMTLVPGAYSVDDFSFNGMAAAGTVRPFLARLTGDNTYETVWVGDAVGGALGGVSVDPTGGFTLTTGETLFAGFYTADGGRVAFTEGVARPPGFGVTDHAGTVTPVTGAGEAITNFSNANLERTYSFSIGVAPVPEPGAATLLAAAAGGLFVRRRRA
jgi:hypothetical protein